VTDAAELLARHVLSGEHLRQGLSERTLLGTFLIEHLDVATVHAVALAGFDFAIIDLEHSSAVPSDLVPLVAAAASVDLPVIVRVSDASPGALGKVLDLGPAGVMIPRIRSVGEAVLAVRSCRFPPSGTRGCSPLTHLAGAGVPTARLGAAPLVVVQIETAEAVASAGQLAAIDGLDVLFAGPYDLAQALGTPDDIDSAEVRAAIDTVANAAGERVALGGYVGDPGAAGDWQHRGFRLLCVGFDGQMLRARAAETAHAARTALS
jgi:4-hydroxy-2-oxoheptanedioate aldolase